MYIFQSIFLDAFLLPKNYKMKVDLFVPCVVDQFYPEIAFNAIKLFQKLNIDFHYNPEQTCCGKSAFYNGYIEESKNLANKFLKDFSGERNIVSLSPACAAFIRQEYSIFFQNTDKIHANERVTSKVYELTDFLVNKCKIKNTDAEFHAKVTYHDSCSALNKYGIKEEPRTLLKNVKGLELIEMKENDVCCGYGGSFATQFKQISTSITARKVQNALDTGAEYIVSAEASCLMNLESYIKKRKLPIKTIHIATILASGL